MRRCEGSLHGRTNEAGAVCTLADVLRRRAATEPEHIAYTFVRDGEGDEETITYRALDGRARGVAAALASTASSEAPVMLLFEPGLDFIAAFFGCLQAGVVAVPVYPPEPRDPASGIARIRRVAADAGASIVLTTRGVERRLSAAGASLASAGLVCRAVDEIAPVSESAAGYPCGRDGVDVAFLQYTSGSTGTPRGVMVTHANLIAHGARVARVLALDAQAVAVSWLPVYHDMGLIGTVLIPLQVGFHSIQMSPLAFLERPLRWLQAISRHRGTLSPAPNFAFDLVVRKTTVAERRGLDLRTWRAAMNGAEPIRAETCERFIAAFAPCGFRREAFVPCYGLAEATLMVAGGPAGSGPMRRAVDGASLDTHRVVTTEPDAPGARILVGSGRPIPDVEVHVMHPETGRPCGDGEVGELWLAGPTVAAGYWRRDDDTAAVFRARGRNARDMLRTGDLGFVDADGVVFVTGRCKDLIVLRGRNYYPQDLEATATAAHPALRPGGAAAFAIDDDADGLVVVHEADGADRPTLAAAATALRDAIARVHGLHVRAVVLIPPRTLPKTSSGKVRRHACRAALAARELPVLYAEPSDAPAGIARHATPTLRRCDAAAVEDMLTAIVAELRDVPRTDIRRDAALAALGIDSAEAANLAAALEAKLGRPVPLAVLMEQPTIAAVAGALVEVAA